MFEGILIGLAALCAVYFVVIVLYAGIGTSFAFIWLFFSALLLFLVYGRWYYEKNQSQIPPWVPVSIVTTCLLGLVSLVLGLLGVAVLITYSPQNGLILLVLAFLVSPYGLPLAAIWLLGKVQDLKFAIQDLIYG